MKYYNYNFYPCLSDALSACEEHQSWNVISIYPTGRNSEVTLVYFNERKD